MELTKNQAVLDWIADTFAPGEVLVSLMSQYPPQPGAAGRLARRFCCFAQIGRAKSGRKENPFKQQICPMARAHLYKTRRPGGGILKSI